jgi:hypothetical protein
MVEWRESRYFEIEYFPLFSSSACLTIQLNAPINLLSR